MVSMTREFALKANVDLEGKNRLVMKTVGGMQVADAGYAKAVSVGGAEATGVVVAVLRDNNAFGEGRDGLLGMTYLARFKMKLSQGMLELVADK